MWILLCLFHSYLRNALGRLRANSRSSFGVTCDFLMKPWSRTISSPTIPNSTRNPVLQRGADFIESLAERLAHRHADRPAELDYANILANLHTVRFVGAFQPIANRFRACLAREENHCDFLHDHKRYASEMVRPGKD